jgi:hypothetical protein
LPLLVPPKEELGEAKVKSDKVALKFNVKISLKVDRGLDFSSH